MPIVGTAGHVDHGKSTLIRALTGRDPDRWDEEKARGLTIDLGFAWTTLEDGSAIGFVDVPGHERFVKNMLAGVGAIDVALFVVAADEGWMPQSEEHLAVLDLLGVDSGIIVLTRADLVDADLLELAELEVRERLEGTSLEHAPILPTSAPTGGGIPELRTAISDALAKTRPAEGDRTRLWVDRAFTIGGAGTVVTGTLVEGSIAVGDHLVLYPEGDSVRVRGLQSHEQSVEIVGPGTRTAVNLVGIDRDDISRGAMLGRDGDWRPTERFSVEIRTIREIDEPLRSRGAYRLHVGSGSWPAQLRLLDASSLTGVGTALVTVDAPVALRHGDRFVVRDVGRRAVVAGGRVLDPHPPRRGAALRESVTVLRSDEPVADALLRIRRVAPIAELIADSGGNRPSGGLEAGDLLVDRAEVARLTHSAIAHTRAYQQRHPLRPGVPKPELASAIGVGAAVVEAVVADSDVLVEQGAHIRTADFLGTLDASGEQAWTEAEATLRREGLTPPRRSELNLDREQIHVVVREERAVEVSDDFLYLPGVLDDLVRDVRTELADGFTVSEFRDHFDISRKHAVPLLEWLDRAGVTRREGDERVVRE